MEELVSKIMVFEEGDKITMLKSDLLDILARAKWLEQKLLQMVKDFQPSKN